MHCRHVTADVEAAAERVVAERARACEWPECSAHPSKLVACLESGCTSVACSARHAGHAGQHALESGHMLGASMANAETFVCFTCHPPPPPPATTTETPHEQAQAPSNAYTYDVASESFTAPHLPGSNHPPDLALAPTEALYSTGLDNLGNTCYLNAAVQALASQPLLAHFFLDCPAALARAPNNGLARAFAGLLAVMASGAHESVAPLAFVRAVGQANADFGGFGQQDTQELLRCVLDTLHDELKNAAGKSVVSESLGGVVASSVCCATCGTVSVSTEPFLDLCVELPDRHTLQALQAAAALPSPPASAAAAAALLTSAQTGAGTGSATTENAAAAACDGGWLASLGSWLGGSWLGGFFSGDGSELDGIELTLAHCLATFCKPEVMTGENQYVCSKCAGKQDAVKFMAVATAPELLCVTVKRFTHNASHQYQSKINKHVEIPAQLDLSPFMVQAPSGATSVSLYDLSAVICHHGGLAHGHYVAYTCDATTGQWHCFDDASVTPVTWEEVRQAQAYCLFYKRSSAAATNFSAAVLDSFSQAAAERTPNVFISREWVNKFINATAPGPLDNSDFTCEHGRVLPDALGPLLDWAVTVPASAFSVLARRFGTVPPTAEIVCPPPGNPLNALVCTPCADTFAALQARRVAERARIRDAESATSAGDVDPDPANPWHMVHSAWVARWRAFVGAEDLATLPPGPIDNAPLLLETGKVRPGLRSRVDYLAVSRATWRVLVDIYGGGPDIARPHTDMYRP